MALEESTDNTITKALDEQYRVTQYYCNAQIALHNANTARSPNHEFDTAFVNFEMATERVMANVEKVFTYPDITDEHKQLTKRILDTIYRQGAFSVSGIAVNTSYDTKSTLVSLSILRASIQRVKNSLAI